MGDDSANCRTDEELERHDVLQFWIEGVAQVHM
jgi:hypothetical protein